jgi:hypothetical protein
MPYPPQLEYQDRIINPKEQDVIEFRDHCLKEFRSIREQLGVSRRNDRAAKFLFNEGQWPKDLQEMKPYFMRVVLNLVRNVVLRKAGMLTEARPEMHVLSRTGNEEAANTLEKVIRGVCRARNLQQGLADGVVMAQRDGGSPCTILWNPDLDYGRGDIDIRFLQSEQVAFDPACGRAANLQNAEWICISSVRPLEEFKVIYPRRGGLVVKESNLSTYDSRYASGSVVKSPVQSMLSVWKKKKRSDQYMVDSAIPRATEHLLYLRDRTLNPDHPFFPDGSPNYIFPRKRLIASAGNVVLYDGPSKYWDGNYPLEILDWGIETDHPFGESEVDIYRTLQEAINSLLAGAVHNARLMNNPPKKVSPNVDPITQNELELYGDEIGKVWSLDNPDADVKEFLVQPYTAEVLEVVKVLSQAIEMTSGLGEASQGRVPKGVTASGAIDQLITAAQTVVRFEGRCVEDFLSRIGQLLISRVIQFYTGSRLIRDYGHDGELISSIFQRSKLIEQLKLAGTEEERDRMLQEVFQDFVFDISPFSSLESNRRQKLQEYLLYKQMGMVDSLTVLKMGGVPNPEKRLAEAQKEQQEQMKSMMMAKALSAGGGKKGGGSLGGKQTTPSPLRGMPGSPQ